VTVPVTIVTGFLGAGKTTSILATLANRPPGGRWAVVVNEVGAVGVDSARLASDGVEVREVLGGCVCCTGGLELKVALVRILREVRPDRLIIEPSGAALPWAVVDALRAPGMREVVAPRAIIGLVDPRRLADPRIRASDVFREQLEVADVLVATHADEASEADLARFDALVGALWPPKVAVARRESGEGIPPAWLDLDPAPPAAMRLAVAHPSLRGTGRIWPPTVAFDVERLETALQALARSGIARIKGILRTTRGWRQVDGTDVELRWQPSPWRRDSRLEILSEKADCDTEIDLVESARVVWGADFGQGPGRE
jgi:G3E family GTPase